MMTLFRIDNANDGILYTASSDGTISCTDLDTGMGSPLLNLNPNGWNVSLLSSQASMDYSVEICKNGTANIGLCSFAIGPTFHRHRWSHSVIH